MQANTQTYQGSGIVRNVGKAALVVVFAVVAIALTVGLSVQFLRWQARQERQAYVEAVGDLFVEYGRTLDLFVDAATQPATPQTYVTLGQLSAQADDQAARLLAIPAAPPHMAHFDALMRETVTTCQAAIDDALDQNQDATASWQRCIDAMDRAAAVNQP